MKLYEVNYMEDCETCSYLTVGNDDDTPESIEKRETEKLQEKNSCFMGCWATEISEVDGHKIQVI